MTRFTPLLAAFLAASCATPSALPASPPSVSATQSAPSYEVPKGWSVDVEDPGQPDGQSPTSYQIGRDPSTLHDGKATFTIKATNAGNQDWRAMGQAIQADRYRNKRVRLTGYVKTSGVTVAGIWMRVDEINHTAAFDNMMNRGIKGDTDWRKYAVVLDVPDDAVALVYGGLELGGGQTWFSEFSVEVVDPAKVPVTMGWMGPDYTNDPTSPQNLPLAGHSKSNPKQIPGWMLDAGESAQGEVAYDPAVTNGGAPTISIQTRKSDTHVGFVQEIKAGPYIGKRIAFKTYIKATGKVLGGSMLAIPGGGDWAVGQIQQLVDNGKKWVPNSSEWKSSIAVVDVPHWAKCIQFGVQLDSPGHIWASKPAFFVVDPRRVRTTNQNTAEDMYTKAQLDTLPTAPSNLSFEN